MPPADLSEPTPDVYRRLQEHLDEAMPVPFPATRTGAELRILRLLFSEAEAHLALCLGTLPEPISVIHRRVGRRRIDRDALAATLNDLARRGLVHRVGTRQRPLFGKAPFVVGFYEAQVNRLTPEFQRAVEEYADEGFGEIFHEATTPQLRTVPINQPIAFERAVGSYDDIRALVRASEGPFAVMNCICQQGKDLIGKPCKQTSHREHCLTLGSAAKSMVRRGDARFLSRDEMLGLLDEADREGLVVQPQNTQSPLFICCCCGCCCGVLTTAKHRPHPAASFANNFVVRADSSRCSECGACVSRCQMEAIRQDEGPAVISVERCIGCGLCISTCPADALQLIPKSERPVPPPRNPARLYLRMFRDRYGVVGVVRTVVRRALGLRT